jgi:8-oxo-dGTP pyrophosphatase MutT (NUDIX family)
MAETPLRPFYERIEPMNYEKSCGAVVYRKFHGNTEILLIRHIKSGCWSFPKGHVEKGETEIQTAAREIKEETNIDVLIDDGFRETVTFSPRRDTSKTVVYFVGKAISRDAKPQLDEISEMRWMEIGQAISYLTYENDKIIATKAKAFISLMK